MNNKFDEAIQGLPNTIKDILVNLPNELKAKTCEINLRTNRPLCLQTLTGTYFLKQSLEVTKKYQKQNNNYLVVNKNDIEETMKIITQYSIHSFKDEINQGYITILGGHRVGLSGTGSFIKNEIQSVSDINSINLRIAREINNSSKELLKLIDWKNPISVLIAGSPSSGKTTIIRDLCKNLSDGQDDVSPYKVSLIDERNEIAAVKDGIAQNDVGVLTDIFNSYKKSIAIEIAIRVMSPKIIIIDEIGTTDEKNAILSGANAGVKVIATVHARSFIELENKPEINELLKLKVFEKIIFLEGENCPCKIKEVVNMSDF